MIAIAEPRTKLDAQRIPLTPNYPPFKKWKRSAIGEKLQDRPMCLYLHIPFCTQRCSFCYYKTVDLKERPELDPYVDALCKEIKLVADHFDLGNRPIHAIYFGGGTPSLLQEHHFEKLVGTLRENFKQFDNHQQFALEAEPLTISKSKLETLAQLGVTRLSMGIQSFVEDIIQLSGRGHNQKQAYRAIEMAQKAGQGKWTINIDLLSGLAGETDETWKKSVECAIGTGVESITVYQMEAFTNTDFYKQGVREEKINLPDAEQEKGFMQYAMGELTRQNYIPWSFFTYTKNNSDRSEYIYNIWQGMEFYGLGVSAFGSMDNFLLQNTSDLDKYGEIVNAGELPLVRGYKFTCQDLMVRDVLLGMKLLRFDLNKFKSQYGFKLESLCAQPLGQLEAEGFITIGNDEVTLTDKGILHGDFVGHTVSEYLRKLHS